MKVLSVDKIADKPIITSFEGHQYPFYGVIYHPEFAFLEVMSRNPNIHLIKDEKITELALQISKFFANQASKNIDHKINSNEAKDMCLKKIQVSLYSLNE